MRLRWLNLALFLSVAGLIVLWLSERHKADEFRQIAEIQAPVYGHEQASSKPIVLGGLPQASAKPQRVIQVVCEFLIASPEVSKSGDVRLPNLFQTADGNAGLRIEFSDTTQRTWSWAFIAGASGGPGYFGVQLAKAPVSGMWHTLGITVVGDSISIVLDGDTIYRGAHPDLAIDTTNIIVGSGFAATRRFCGEIRGFRVETAERDFRAEALADRYRSLAILVAILTFLGNVVWTIYPRAGWAPVPHLVDTEAGAVQTWGRLRLILAVFAAGHLVAAVYYYWMAVYWGRLNLDGYPYPYNTYLSLPSVRFSDFDNMLLMCKGLNPYHDHSRSGYPPFANLFYYFFSLLPGGVAFAVYAALPLLGFAILGALLLRGLRRLQLFFAVVCLQWFCYPTLFALDRGNLDLYLALCTATFLVFINNRSAGLRFLACLALGAGIALKIYPALFLILLLKDRRFRDALSVLLIAQLFTILSAAVFVGGAHLAIRDFLHMLSVTDDLVRNELQYAFANSGLYYGLLIVFRKMGADLLIHWLKSYYWLLAGGLLVVYSLAIMRARVSYWASSVAVVSLICLLPSLSNDYRTVHFLFPMLLFARSSQRFGVWRVIFPLMWGLLLVPRNYWILFPEVAPGDIGISSVVTPLVIFLLMNVSLYVSEARSASVVVQ